MKKKWMIVGIMAVLAMIIAILLIPKSTKNGNTTRDLRSVEGSSLSLHEGVLYCKAASPVLLEDEFSRVYSKAVKINVVSIDETEMTATITIFSPPLKEIMERSLPKNMNKDYQTVFDTYMADIYFAVSNCPEEDMISTTVCCSVVEDAGFKIIPNNDFTNAVFPNIQRLLADLMLETLSKEEG